MQAQGAAEARRELIPEQGAAPLWHPALRFAFRFLFSYYILYLVTEEVVALIPYSGGLVRKYVALWLPVVTWVGKRVLHLDQDIYLLEGNDGVSNTAFGTVLFLCYVTLAFVAAVAWSALDRRRTGYDRLYAWFRFLVRCTLAMALIRYGAIKVIPTQMAAPLPLGFLTTRIGDLTPMRMLWIFMGSSPGYESFTGCAEILGGLLLLVPRTTLLGAVICAADMTMVVALNLGYDVHVKLRSFHLLFMALLLIAPDLRRLADLFLFNRRVEPGRTPALFARRSLDRIPHALLILAGLYTAWIAFDSAWMRYRHLNPPRPPLYGVWSVEELTVDGKPVEPATEPKGWRSVMFQRPGMLTVEHWIGSWEGYPLDLDMKAKTMRLGKGRGAFSFAEPEEHALVLDGLLDGRRMHVALRRMPLTATRFSWFVDIRKDEEEDAKKARQWKK